MSTLAIILIVTSSLALAISQVLSKYFQNGEWAERSALVASLQSGAASIMLFTFSFMTGGPHLSSGWLLPILATGFLNIGIIFAKMRARALEDVSLVTPIDSTTPALVIITAMIIVGEYPSALGWLGIWVLVIGTYILNIQELRQKLLGRQNAAGSKLKRELRVWFAPFLALNKSAGVRWAFFAVLLSTFSLPFDGLTARRADVGFGFGLVFAIAASGNLIFAFARHEHKGVKAKEVVQRFFALGLTFATSTILTGLAFQISLVAYIGTMKRMTIPFAIILAFLFLKERKSFKQRIVGGTIMAAGAVIIALAK